MIVMMMSDESLDDGDPRKAFCIWDRVVQLSFNRHPDLKQRQVAIQVVMHHGQAEAYKTMVTGDVWVYTDGGKHMRTFQLSALKKAAA